MPPETTHTTLPFPAAPSSAGATGVAPAPSATTRAARRGAGPRLSRRPGSTERPVEQLLCELEHLREHVGPPIPSTKLGSVIDLHAARRPRARRERRRRRRPRLAKTLRRAHSAHGARRCRTRARRRRTARGSRVDVGQVLGDLEPDRAVAGHHRVVAETACTNRPSQARCACPRRLCHHRRTAAGRRPRRAADRRDLRRPAPTRAGRPCRARPAPAPPRDALGHVARRSPSRRRAEVLVGGGGARSSRRAA